MNEWNDSRARPRSMAWPVTGVRLMGVRGTHYEKVRGEADARRTEGRR